MEELKPCPLCKDVGETHEDHDHRHFVECVNKYCNCSTGYFDSEAEAITAWNTRPSPWIKITPETNPKTIIEKDYWMTDEAETWLVQWEIVGYDDDSQEIWGWFDGRGKFLNGTHYMPIPPLPEKK